MNSRIVTDAFIVTLLGIVLGFSFNYARKDGVPIIKSQAQVEESQASEATESISENPIEPVWIELEEAITYFEGGTALFIDSRDEEEYQEGHIQGAVNIPYGWYLNEHPDLSQFIPENKTLITYCSGSECESSVELAYAMWEGGYSGIKIFFGGWQEWVNSDLPIELD